MTLSAHEPPPIGLGRPLAAVPVHAESGHSEGATIAPFSLTCKQLLLITEGGAPFPPISHELTNCRFGRRGRCPRRTATARHDAPHAHRGGPRGHGRHRAHGLRRHRAPRIQGADPRRPAQRPGAAARPRPRATRRWTAGAIRRRAGDERKPGVHRRPARRRGVVLDRRVLEGAHRRHYADRRDEGRDANHAPLGHAAGAARTADHTRRPDGGPVGDVGTTRAVCQPTR